MPRSKKNCETSILIDNFKGKHMKLAILAYNRMLLIK